eukprot:NODE_7581_length_756_cov_127.796209_g7332_i0.p1 GENE.NODE_7581_length_756_cov_127.796209_g7332_i0~~NODE_7581_length_756_cov_127.796209_g7332_i0.p1  ORF type:complete len:213 (-),score=98.08 NODE_7581_length_756_cov_127.796209_g7332_i0:117-704(-)
MPAKKTAAAKPAPKKEAAAPKEAAPKKEAPKKEKAPKKEAAKAAPAKAGSKKKVKEYKPGDQKPKRKCGKKFTPKKPSTKPSIRLFQPGLFLGFKRTQRNQDPNTALIAIKGVKINRDTKYYMGKRVLYLFKGQKKKGSVRSKQQPKMMTRTRRIWGKVIKAHGKSGVVKAKFKTNLPPQAIGRKVRVYMFPSNI